MNTQHIFLLPGTSGTYRAGAVNTPRKTEKRGTFDLLSTEYNNLQPWLFPSILTFLLMRYHR